MTPDEIRAQFAELWEDWGPLRKEYILRALSSYVPTSVLEEFMDDLKHERI
jgi:hypothetical protein